MSRTTPQHATSIPITRTDAWLLGAAYVVISIALVGFATFGLHPEWLAASPQSAALYGPIYTSVGQIQIWVLWGILAAVLIRHARLRWVPAFIAVYVLSFLSEFFGTSYGIPFGGYGYTGLLGGKWLDQVPYVIPLSWFAMAIPSFALARAFGIARTPTRRILIAAAILLAWDLALDPAMSHLTPYWVWSDSGPYYGMPWMNLLGWYATGLVLMGALTGLRADRWVDGLNLRWMGAYYAVNILMPVGMMAAAGMWLGVVTTFTVYVLLIGLALLRPRRVPVLTAARDLPA